MKRITFNPNPAVAIALLYFSALIIVCRRSDAAALDVGTTFTRILSGPGLTQDTESASWVDYDGDGRLDLLVVGIGGGLFHNTADQGLVRVPSALTRSVTKGTAPWSDAAGAVWGDFDNDGLPDVFVPQGWNTIITQNALFHNDGNGNFSRVITGPIATDLITSFGGTWGDYDGDGWLDLFVPCENTRGGPAGPAVNSMLYHNKGDGTFERITNGTIAEFQGYANAAAWGDFNDDGRLDLFVASSGSRSALYVNQGGGEFDSFPGSLPRSPDGASFGDIDNDGHFELFVASANSPVIVFTGDAGNLSVGNIDSDSRPSMGVALADYDNDGWLDVFVPHTSFFVSGDATDALYHNNGDGTFTRVNSSTFSIAGQIKDGAAWGDYDNDGFLDLFVAAIDGQSRLFHNDGNTNNWLAFNLKATISNRSAIGTKVRVQATIAGKTFWQVRQVSGGEGWCSQNDPRPHFGLGDAAVATQVRIEWPSGQVQELTNVAAKQFLTVTEPSGPPKLKAAIVEGALRLIVTGAAGVNYELQWTSNFVGWQSLTNLAADADGLIIYETPMDHAYRFYQVLQQ